MDGWWDEIDAEILDALARVGLTSPEELATRLGMSVAAMCSCLAMLAADGKVHIRSVEAVPRSLVRVA